MLAAFLLPFASQAQTPCATLNLPFNETFDSTSTTRSCWTTIDADADGNGWTTLYNNVEQGVMLSFSYDNSYGALTPDNWLISPKLHTVAGNDLTLQWTVSAGNNTYFAEHYGVYVSTTTTDTSAFTLLNQWTLSDANSHEMILDLSAYAGQDIYVAFRHFNCTDEFVLIIDDVEVYEGAYVPDTLNVTFAVNDATLGTTSPAPGTYQYITGDTVTFSAIPTGSNVFTGWEMIAGADTTMLGTGYIEASFLASNMMSYGSLTFTANFLSCDAVDLPFTETFDDTSATRYCWNLVSNNTSNVGGTNGMGFVTVDGREVLRFSSYSSATDYNQYAYSPLMNVSSDATNLQVSVVYGTRANDYLYFGYITASNDTVWDTTAYNTNSSASTYNWDTYTAVIPATATQLVAHYYGNYAYYAWIDNVNVIELTGDYCYPVANLSLDTATASSVTLSWDDENNTGATYSIYAADGTVVADGISGTSYTIHGLSAMTAYTFAVAANCSATSSSSRATIDVATACADASCDITIVGADSYGDGWNGNAIDVMQAGVVVGNFTIATGNSNSETYSICSSAPVSFRWVNGNYAYETSFQIYDGGNSLVYTGAGSDMSADSIFFTLANACPSCLPAVVTVDSVTETSVTLHWVGHAASYDIYNGETYVTTTTDTTYTLTGLTPATSYTFGVQAICTGNDTATMTVINVMTACADVTTLPYLESFELGLGCWSVVSAPASDVSWDVFATSAHDGTHVALSYSYDSYGALNADTWLISPKFDLPVTTDGITFSWWEIADEDYPDSYSVAISTTTDDTSAFTVIRPMQQAAGEWTQRYVDLSAYAGQNVYLAFHHQDYDMNYLFIDEVELYQGAYVEPDPDTLTVTFAVNDATMGTTVPAPGTYTYLTGDTVEFAAEFFPGYHFVAWTVTADGMTDTLTDYMTAYAPMEFFTMYFGNEMTLTAIFEAGNPDSTTITYAVNDATMGTLNPAPGTYTIYVGDEIAAHAFANPGYHLEAWVLDIFVEGALVSSDTIDSFDDDFSNPMLFGTLPQTFPDYGATLVVTALFEEGDSGEHDYVTVTFAVNDPTMGDISPRGTQTFLVGDEISITATPAANCYLVSWTLTIDGETQTFSDNPPLTFTDTVEAIWDGAVLTANFARHQGIDDVETADFQAYSLNGKVVVRGVENRDVSVYDVTGRQIQAIKHSSNQATVDVPAAGVYMVKVGNAVKRVVVIR